MTVKVVYTFLVSINSSKNPSSDTVGSDETSKTTNKQKIILAAQDV